MKKTVFALLAIITVTVGMAQEDKSRTEQEFKTIFNVNRNNNKVVHGGYGAILMNYTQIDNKDAFLAGIRGMWIVNHGIGIGLGGYGVSNEIKFDQNAHADNQDYSLAGGYGGLTIEPIIMAKSPVHVSFPVLIGAGGVATIQEQWSPYQYHDDNYYTEDAQAYFVIEPGVELEFNMVKFFRVALGAYYRYTSDVTLQTWTGSEYKSIKPDLSGFSFGLTLKFGKF